MTFKVYYRGEWAGTHKTKALAEKRAQRLIAMARDKTEARRHIEIREESSQRHSNPMRAEIDAARGLYRAFRDANPKGIKRITLSIPKALMQMGRVDFIAYTTTHNGQVTAYKHTFAPGSQPILAAGTRRGQLYLIKGRFRVTGRGIVDLDAHGREIG